MIAEELLEGINHGPVRDGSCIFVNEKLKRPSSGWQWALIVIIGLIFGSMDEDGEDISKAGPCRMVSCNWVEEGLLETLISSGD